MVSSNCAVCGSKKSRFIKEQKAGRILSSLGLRTPSGKIPFVGFLFFRGINPNLDGLCRGLF